MEGYKIYKILKDNVSIYSSHKDPNEKIVVKKIEKNNYFANEEKHAHQNIDHKNIVKTIDMKEDDDYTYIILEYIDGYDLFEYLERQEFCPLDEYEAKNIFRQLIDAVEYCHSKGVAHRDIKLENIMLSSKGVKLIDFGLCCTNCNRRREEWCGTELYASPEIIKRKAYNAYKTDVWNLGIVLFIMLSGEFPFGSVEELHSYKDFDKLYFLKRNTSDSAIDLLRKMMHNDMFVRINISDVKNHIWLK